MKPGQKMLSVVLAALLVLGALAALPFVALAEETCTHKTIGRIQNQYNVESFGKEYKSIMPTCTEDGIVYSYCQGCGEELYSTVYPAFHRYEGWTVDNGVQKRECTVCHKSDTIEIPLLALNEAFNIDEFELENGGWSLANDLFQYYSDGSFVDYYEAIHDVNVMFNPAESKEYSIVFPLVRNISAYLSTGGIKITDSNKQALIDVDFETIERAMELEYIEGETLRFEIDGFEFKLCEEGLFININLEQGETYIITTNTANSVYMPLYDFCSLLSVKDEEPQGTLFELMNIYSLSAPLFLGDTDTFSPYSLAYFPLYTENLCFYLYAPEESGYYNFDLWDYSEELLNESGLFLSYIASYNRRFSYGTKPMYLARSATVISDGLTVGNQNSVKQECFYLEAGYSYRFDIIGISEIQIDGQMVPTGAGFTFSFLGAELPEYTVTFIDHDGTSLKEQTTVQWGTAATAPADPAREGYEFTGWDTDFSNVTGNLTVTATYKQTSFEDPGTGIIVDGDFGTGTQMQVTDLNAGSIALVTGSINGKINAAYDIKFIKDNEEVQPNGSVIVRLPFKDVNPSTSANWKVYHVERDETGKIIKSTEMETRVVEIDGAYYWEFETDHFSVYAVVEEAPVDPTPCGNAFLAFWQRLWDWMLKYLFFGWAWQDGH